MNIHDNTQAGFGTVAILSIVFLILLVGLIGWRLYSQLSQQANNATSGNQSTNTSSTPPQGTNLDIKELGIKVRLDDSIKDVVYSYNQPAESPVYEHDIGTVYLSTRSLIARDSNCNPTRGVYPLGLIDEFVPITFADKLSPNATTLFKFGQNYFFLSPPTSPCSTNPSVNALAAQQRATFFNDFKSVQLDH